MRYTTVLHELRILLNLSLIEYCVLDSIYNLSCSPKFTGKVNRTYLADFFKVDRKTITRTFKTLEELSLIENDKPTEITLGHFAPVSETFCPSKGDILSHNNNIYKNINISKEKIPDKKKNSFSLDGKDNKLSLSLNEVIEVWNSVKVKGWKQYNYRPGTNVANNLISSYKKNSSLFTKEEYYKGLENYIKDIESRDEQTSYGKHRFDLPTFFKQSNGLEKFIDL